MTKVGQWSRDRWKQVQAYALATVGTFLAGIGALLLNITASSDRATQAIGGALVGAGITMFITDVTSRRTIREQYFSVANIKRRDEVYGPLHEQVVGVQTSLHMCRDKESPYPGVILTSPEQPTHIYGMPIPGKLELIQWSELRTSFRRDYFTKSTQHLLDNLIQAANVYNDRFTHLRQPTVDILGRRLEAEIQKLISTYIPDDDQWLDRYRSNPPSGLTRGTNEVNAWVNALPVLGWILADSQSKLVQQIIGWYNVPAPAYPPPPSTWVERVVVAAWQELQEHPSYRQAREAVTELVRLVDEAERTLQTGLSEIQSRFEGGRPIV